MKEDGHNYTFGAPSKGWPSFGPDGRIVKEPRSKSEAKRIAALKESKRA